MGEIKIGSKVVVVDRGECFSSYDDFFKEQDIDNYGYRRGENPQEDVEYFVVYIGEHHDKDKRPIYVITDGKFKYLMSKKGIILLNDDKSDIIRFLRTRCDFECQQENVIELVKMILKKIEEK